MDFMSDTLNDGCSIRAFNVIDEKVNAGGRDTALGHFNRAGLCIDAYLLLSNARVIQSLEQIIE